MIKLHPLISSTSSSLNTDPCRNSVRSVKSSDRALANASRAHKFAASNVSSPAATASKFSRLMLSICVALLRELVLAVIGFVALLLWLLIALLLVVGSFTAVAIKSSRGSNQSGSMPSTDGMGLRRPTELALEDARCRKSGDNWKPLQCTTHRCWGNERSRAKPEEKEHKRREHKGTKKNRNK